MKENIKNFDLNEMSIVRNDDGNVFKKHNITCNNTEKIRTFRNLNSYTHESDYKPRFTMQRSNKRLVLTI